MSYFSILQLEREPFAISPDPAFFYRSREHYTALNRLEIAIRLKKGLSIILGEVGTGKTTLSRALFQAFNGEGNYLFHMILDPSFKTEYQFWTHLAKLFGINPFFRSTVDYREALERFLFQKCVEERKTVVLVIDEGQKLSQANLETLRVLLNYETNEYKMLQLVILAQMELLDQLKMIPNFMDRVTMKYILHPLDEFETGQMIEHRLRSAGYKGKENLFTREAVKRIYHYSQGYPRRIARLCHQAIEHLVMEDGEFVQGGLIDKITEQEMVWS